MLKLGYTAIGSLGMLLNALEVLVDYALAFFSGSILLVEPGQNPCKHGVGRHGVEFVAHLRGKAWVIETFSCVRTPNQYPRDTDDMENIDMMM